MQLDTPNYIILRINEVTTRPLAETTFPNRGLRAVKAANAHELAYRTTDNTVVYFPSEDKLTASGGSFIGVSAPSVAATNLNSALEEIYQAATGGAFPTPVIDGSFLFRNTDGSYGIADGAAVPVFRWDGSQYLVNGTLKANVFDLAGKYQIKSQAYGIQVDDTLGGDFRFKVGGTALDINAASNGVDNVTSRFVQDTTFNDTGLEITNGAVTTDFYDANGRSRLFAQELNQGEAYVEVGTQYTNGLNYVTVNGVTVNVNSTDLNLTAGGVFTLRGSQGSRIYFNINGAQAPDANSAFIGAYSSGGFGQSALLLQSGQKNGGGAGAGIQLNHNQTLLYSESGNTSSGFVKVEGGRIEVFTGNSRGVYFQNNVNSRVDVRFVDPELTFYTPTKITGLDGNGFLGDATALVQSMINSSIIGTATYKGSWNASTNTPTLPTVSEQQGDFYIVSVAGSTLIDGINEWSVGDWIIYNGTTYEKVDNSQTIPANVGGGAEIFKGLDNVTNVADFRTLSAGSNITINQNANDLVISSTGGISDAPSDSTTYFRKNTSWVNDYLKMAQAFRTGSDGEQWVDNLARHMFKQDGQRKNILGGNVVSQTETNLDLYPTGVSLTPASGVINLPAWFNPTGRMVCNVYTSWVGFRDDNQYLVQELIDVDSGQKAMRTLNNSSVWGAWKPLDNAQTIVSNGATGPENVVWQNGPYYMTVTTGSSNYPATFGLVFGVKEGTSRHVQYFYERFSSNVYFRYQDTSSDTWSSWTLQGSGANKKRMSASWSAPQVAAFFSTGTYNIPRAGCGQTTDNGSVTGRFKPPFNCTIDSWDFSAGAYSGGFVADLQVYNLTDSTVTATLKTGVSQTDSGTSSVSLLSTKEYELRLNITTGGNFSRPSATINILED